MSIVEKMADAANDVRPDSEFWCTDEMMRAALTATGLAEAQLEGLANGTMVVVPVVPTEAMQGAGTTAWLSRAPRAKMAEITSDIYRAMLAAKEE